MTDALTPNSSMTEEELMVVRQNLIIETQKKYHELMNFIRSIPIVQQAFSQAFLYTDTGMLWVVEALSRAPFTEEKSNDSSSAMN